MTPTHTPTPWFIEYSHAFEIRYGKGYAGHVICSPSTGDHKKDEANAAFIVRACNAHEELVAALQREHKPHHAYFTPTCETCKLLERIDK